MILNDQWKIGLHKCEVGPETRSFSKVKIVKERGSVNNRVESCGQKTAISAVLSTRLVVVHFRWVNFWVIHPFDYDMVRSLNLSRDCIGPTLGMIAEQIADCFGVGIHSSNSCDKVSTVAFHEDGVFWPIHVFVLGSPGPLQQVMILPFRVENGANVVRETPILPFHGRACLPPITLLSPLNIFVKLLTRTSAYGRTWTFKKLPTVSSTMTAKSYLSARVLIRLMSGVRSSGLLGNSVNKAR